MSSKYNILYLHNATYLGGAEKSLLMIVDNIDKDRFNPIFACPSNGIFAEELKKREIKVENVEYAKIRGIKGVMNTVNTLKKIIKDNDIKLLHSNDLRTNLYASFVGKFYHIPVIWHARNLIYKELIDYEKWLSFLPDTIICNGEGIAKRFSFFGKIFKKIKIVYTGIDVNKYNPNIDSSSIRKELNIKKDEIVLAVIGRIGEGKGQDDFIKASSIVAKQFVNVKFLIVGSAVTNEDCWREKYLMNLVKQLNLENKVYFIGFRKDIENILASIDIFVLSSYAEPFGRSLLEAMACGKPVIATNTGGTYEIVSDGETGILIPPKNPIKLAEAMKKLIEDENLRIKMGKAGRLKVKKLFDIKKCIKILEDEYIKLLEK